MLAFLQFEVVRSGTLAAAASAMAYPSTIIRPIINW